MHVRGGALSNSKVVEALQPFIVSYWGQSNNEEIPKDIKPLYEQTEDGPVTNVRCFVMDPDGKMIHWFYGFPDKAQNPTHHTPKQVEDYYVSEIKKATAKLKIEGRKNELKLPDTSDGVRMYIRVKSPMQGSYNIPVVQVVENKAEWDTLSYPSSETKIDAGKLARWLNLCYPPGVNEQLKPYDKVEGTIILKSAGKDSKHRYAILSGKIKLSISESTDHPFEGTFEAVLKYKLDEAKVVSLQGVVSGNYPRKDPFRGWKDWPLTAAIESRPK